MSLKRPLSPESNVNYANNSTRQSKRLKLHSIIQKLQNEEACLALLKKLHTNQQLATQKINNAKTLTNGSHTAEKITIAPIAKPPQLPITNIPVKQQQQQQQQQLLLHQQLQQASLPIAARKSSASPLLTHSNKISKSSSLEEFKTQAKLALRKQLERDLLNISLPKPTLQDIVVIPNGTSVDFQIFLGLEDVVQCLYELQNGRQRLPQRFTDQADTDEPYACDQCGVDFTIRWWKHSNSKLANQVMTILCDRCKKQVTRKSSKSEHSALLKNVFLSAMKQEKEIDKQFNALIKQQKSSSPKPSPAPPSTKPLTTTTTTTSMPSNNHQYQSIKMKNSSSQNTVAKHLQQSKPTTNIIHKSHVNVPLGSKHSTTNHDNHSRLAQHNKSHMPIHHPQQYRSMGAIPPQIKPNETFKVSKTNMKKQPVIPSPRSILPPHPDIFSSFLSSNLLRPTATKRSNFPNMEKK